MSCSFLDIVGGVCGAEERARYPSPLLHGIAAPLPNQEKKRMRIEPVKLEHFVSFITSPHVIQDVPFGEKLLKLSTGENTQCDQNNDTRAHCPVVSTILL